MDKIIYKMKYDNYYKFIILLIILLNLLLLSNLSYTCSWAASTEIKTPIYYFTIEKTENFLKEPAKENLLLLRRIGRLIQNSFNTFNKLEFISFHKNDSNLEFSIKHPILLNNLEDPSYKELASSIIFNRLNFLQNISLINTELPNVDNGINITLDIFLKNLNQIISNKSQNLWDISIVQGKISNKDQIKDFIFSTLSYFTFDYAFIKATLSNTSFKCKAIIVPSENSKSFIAKNINNFPNLSTKLFVDGKSIMYGALSTITSTQDYMKYLSNFNNYKVILSIIKSVGLDYEKDILENYTNELYWQMNFYPHGDGGLPEITGYSYIKNPENLIADSKKYRELASQLGVFVQNFDETNSIYKISYFLFPQFSIYFTIYKNMLLISNASFGISNLLQNVIQNKIYNFNYTNKSINQFSNFRLLDFIQINFENFNTQLQTYLQSSALAKFKIPPIPNIDIVSELDKFELLVYIHNNIFEIDINMPFKFSKN